MLRSAVAAKAAAARQRELLDNAHRWNLRAELVNRAREGRLKEGVQVAIQIGPPLEAVIVVMQYRGGVHLLGGYWRRPGEPNQMWRDQVARYVASIKFIDNR